MGSPVGGDPDAIRGVAGPLRSAGATVGSASSALSSAGSTGSGSVGSAAAAAALARFGAVAARSASDIETQLQAVGTLAANGGTDLAVAGGGRMRAE